MSGDFRTLLTARQVGAAAERLLERPGSGNDDGAGFAMFGEARPQGHARGASHLQTAQRVHGLALHA